MIIEGAAAQCYAWADTPMSGFQNSFLGTESKTGKPVIVTEITIRTSFSAAQRDELYTMCKHKAPACENTGTLRSVQLDHVLYLDSKLWLVSQLIHGVSLPQAVQSLQVYDEATALLWFADIAQSVLALHRQGLLQGELKLSALRVADGPVQIASHFNLQRLAPESAQSSCDWAGAIAPEILLMESKEFSEATDVWNMGVVLHNLLVGEPPLNKGQVESKKIILKRRKECDGKVNIAEMGGWDRISSDTRELVVDMLLLNPEDRLSSEQVYNEVEHIIHRLPCMPGNGEHLQVRL